MHGDVYCPKSYEIYKYMKAIKERGIKVVNAEIKPLSDFAGFPIQKTKEEESQSK